MNTIKVNAGPGDYFENVAKRAKELAISKHLIAEFEFNRIKCLVGELTVIDWLYRDYCNAHIMEWKTVGPDCEMQYNPETEIELYSRKLARAQERKQERDTLEAKWEAQRDKVEGIIGDSKLSIIPDQAANYETFVTKNSQDGYSRAIVDYAEYWGKLMQLQLLAGKKIAEIADSTQVDLDFLGITGYQYGCVVQTLATFWIYGEDLRKWHNKQYGASEEVKGTVNPAILTIGK